MKKRISNTTKHKYKKTLNRVIRVLGKPVEVFEQPAKYECFNCHYDKFTATSSNECKWTAVEAIVKQQEYASAGGVGVRYKYFSRGRCPICKGQGFLVTIKKVWIDCKVTWAPPDGGTDLTYTAAGVEGSTILEIKADPKHRRTFNNCSFIRVDGIECKISKIPILRGLGDKSLMVLTAFTTDKPGVDRDEALKAYDVDIQLLKGPITGRYINTEHYTSLENYI